MDDHNLIAKCKLLSPFSNEDSKKHMKNWGIKLEENLCTVESRVLPQETIHMGNGRPVRIVIFNKKRRNENGIVDVITHLD